MNNNRTFRWGIVTITVFTVGLLGCTNKSVPVKSDTTYSKVQKTNDADLVNIESSNAKSPVLISAPEPTPASPAPVDSTAPDSSLPVETPDVE